MGTLIAVDWFDALSKIQAVAMSFGAVAAYLLLRAFSAGGIWRDFQRLSQRFDQASVKLSKLTSDVNSLPERARREMLMELDRYHENQVKPQLDEAREDRRRIWDLIERRSGQR